MHKRKEIENTNKQQGGIEWLKLSEETKQVIATTAKLYAEKGSKEAEKIGIELDNKRKEIENQFTESNYIANIQKTWQEVDNLTAMYNNLIKEGERIGAETDKIKQAKINETAEIASKIALNEALEDKAYSDANVSDRTATKITSDIAIAFSNLRLQWTRLNDIDRAELKNELDKLDWSKELGSKELEQRIKENLLNYGQKK